MSYEGLDDEKELETVSTIRQNISNSNVDSDSYSDSDDKIQKNLFDEDINKK